MPHSCIVHHSCGQRCMQDADKSRSLTMYLLLLLQRHLLLFGVIHARHYCFCTTLGTVMCNIHCTSLHSPTVSWGSIHMLELAVRSHIWAGSFPHLSWFVPPNLVHSHIWAGSFPHLSWFIPTLKLVHSHIWAGSFPLLSWVHTQAGSHLACHNLDEVISSVQNASNARPCVLLFNNLVAFAMGNCCKIPLPNLGEEI